MKIIQPTAIDDAVLVATNAGETVAAWANGTTYAADAQVRSDATNRVYRSLAADNIGHDPAIDVDPQTGLGAWWQDVGPTNARAMFDAFNQTQTVEPGSIEVELTTPELVNAMALLNLEAATVTVTMTDDVAGEVYAGTFDLTSTDNVGVDYYAWCFEPIIRRTSLHVEGLPAYAGATIAVSIAIGGAVAKCGNLIIGRQRELGGTVYGAGFGIIDRSRKDEDEFGNIAIVERPYRDTGSFDVIVKRQLVDEVGRLLRLYRARPIVYVGTGRFASSIYYGFFRDFRLTLENYFEAKLSIEIEGLT